jgi:hypothetical protein
MTDEPLSLQGWQQAAQAMRRRLVITLVAAVVLIGGGWITLWAAGGNSAVAPEPHAVAASAASRRPSDELLETTKGLQVTPAAGCRPTASRSRSACRSAGGNEKALRADRRPHRETRRPAAIAPRGRAVTQITLRLRLPLHDSRKPAGESGVGGLYVPADRRQRTGCHGGAAAMGFD